MNTEERKCVVCGNKFTATRPNSKYCSDECRDEGRRKLTKANDKAKREREREARKARKNSQKSLVEIAVAAKKAGMNYGEYVARMGV